MIDLLTDILSIPSPTGQEDALASFIQTWAAQHLPTAQVREHNNNVVIVFPNPHHKPHIALVGHLDVVPPHRQPLIKNNRLYGSGASDMLGAVAVYLDVLKKHAATIAQHYGISIILYAREEQTPMVDNGLYELLHQHNQYFDTIDLALVGEPTDLTVQIGCVGSLHAKAHIQGVACHSARPWDGHNALYRALPLIEKMSQLKPKAHEIFGQTFYDVIQITQSHTQPGRTSLPGYWEGNVNFRFAPTRTEKQAWQELQDLVASWQIPHLTMSLIDASPAGDVLETPLFKTVIETMGQPVQAKQAWTDVAQFTAHGMAAFNFGPGLTAQAHRDDEYIEIDMVKRYGEILTNVLCKGQP
jgi:succinyl-diaminopimelate desuccinylase